MPANRRLKRQRKIEAEKLARKQRRETDQKSEAFVEGIEGHLRRMGEAANKAVPPAHLLAKAMVYARQIGAAMGLIRKGAA